MRCEYAGKDKERGKNKDTPASVVKDNLAEEEQMGGDVEGGGAVAEGGRDGLSDRRNRSMKSLNEWRWRVAEDRRGGENGLQILDERSPFFCVLFCDLPLLFIQGSDLLVLVQRAELRDLRHSPCAERLPALDLSPVEPLG